MDLLANETHLLGDVDLGLAVVPFGEARIHRLTLQTHRLLTNLVNPST